MSYFDAGAIVIIFIIFVIAHFYLLVHPLKFLEKLFSEFQHLANGKLGWTGAVNALGLAEVAQNRHPLLNKSRGWPKSRHYIFGKGFGRESFFWRESFLADEESRGLTHVNSISRHYTIKSAGRAT